MIAKITTHAVTRETALADLSRALADTQVAGTVTNLGFLRRLADHDGFRAGGVDTGFIADHLEALTSAAPTTAVDLAAAALIASGMAGAEDPLAGFALWTPLQQSIDLTRDGAAYRCTLACLGARGVTIDVDDQTVVAERRAGKWWLDDIVMPKAALHAGTVTLFCSEPLTFHIVDPLARSSTASAGDQVLAPMPGLVMQLGVRVGEAVEQGARLAVLEAMKMEHVMRAPCHGTVTAVLVAQGDQVAAGQVLIQLEQKT
jgi:3-methylcrotonyl-CoA carboxylase alpha subunit